MEIAIATDGKIAIVRSDTRNATRKLPQGFGSKGHRKNSRLFVERAILPLFRRINESQFFWTGDAKITPQTNNPALMRRPRTCQHHGPSNNFSLFCSSRKQRQKRITPCLITVEMPPGEFVIFLRFKPPKTHIPVLLPGGNRIAVVHYSFTSPAAISAYRSGVRRSYLPLSGSRK